MKKFIVILFLVFLLILGLSVTALAGKAYLDYMIGGTWEIETTGFSNDGDLNGLALGVSAPLDQFLVGLEYFSDTCEDVTKFDVTSWELRGGYAVFNNDTTQLFIGLMYQNASNDDFAMDTFTGYGWALDLVAGSDTILFEGTLGYILEGTTDMITTGDEDATALLLRLRFTYLFSEQVGATLGYRNYAYTVDVADDFDFSSSAFSLGITYNF